MKKDKIILGQDGIFELNKGGNNNVLILGGTGSGKTRSIVEPTLLSTDESSLIVCDPKGRLIERYEQYFKDKGYQVEIIDLVDLRNSTVGYDPVRFLAEHVYIYKGIGSMQKEHLRPISDVDCISLAQTLILSGTRQNLQDPFWDNMSTILLSAAISFAAQHNPIRNRTMAKTMEYLDGYVFGMSNSAMDQFAMMLSKAKVESYGLKQYIKVKQMPQKTLASVYSTVGSILGRLTMSDVEAFMSKERIINPLSFVKEKTVLFVKTSDTDKSLYFLANVMYTQLMNALFKIKDLQKYRDTRPIRFILDDYAASVVIRDLPLWISTMRERDISVMLILQSLTQLDATHGEADAQTIMANCEYLAYLRSNDVLTTRIMSERMDITVQELMYNSDDMVYILQNGHPPIKTMRYDIRKHKEIKKIDGITQAPKQKKKAEEKIPLGFQPPSYSNSSNCHGGIGL